LKNQRKQYEVPKKLQTLGLPNLILAVDHHHPFRSLAAFGLSDAFAPLHHTLISKKTDSIMHNFADFSRFEVCIENGGVRIEFVDRFSSS